MMRFKLTAVGALALIPSLALAQQTTSDTTYTTSEGSLAAPSSNLGLTSEQVKELQQAINDHGCNAGEVTGVIDDATREGIQCIRESKNIESDNINDVLQALGLSFTADTTQSGSAMSDTISSDTVTSDTVSSDTLSDTTDTLMSDTTFQTDSGALQTDTTTVPYDTSAAQDTTMMQDTTTVPDTSALPTDTSTFQYDTSSMTRDSMPSTPTTPPTTTLPDTSRSPMKP